MASSGAVIKATQQFAKSTAGVSIVRELVIGLTLGLAAGSVWKVYHWNTTRKIEQYYYDLGKLKAAEASEEAD